MQIRLAEDVLSLEAREMRVRGEEDVVKAADQRIVRVRAVVPVDAAQLLGESAPKVFQYLTWANGTVPRGAPVMIMPS